MRKYRRIKELYVDMKIRILTVINKVKWLIKNPHNKTSIDNLVNINCIHVGDNTYGTIHAITSRNDVCLNIGSFCSIAEDVKFIVSSDHPLSYFSTYPFKTLFLNEPFEAISKGDIILDDDVWIGFGATIMSGVHIKQGAVVAAGSVVTKDVPPYAIVGGVPAKIIRYRFSEDIIKEMLKIDYKKINPNFIRRNINDFYAEIHSLEQVEEFNRKAANSDRE